MAVGLTAPTHLSAVAGIRLGMASAGFKQTVRPDLVLIEMAAGATCAAVFTQNAFCAAPVLVAREHMANHAVRYLLINSGNANAGTGKQGYAAAQASCEAVASQAACDASEVLPFSTGVIGELLPIDKLQAAVPQAYANLDEDGWFDTGDIANIDELGYMQITDRDKDVIKSGGEWISSIEIENTAVGCEGVAEAAVIGVAHPKWTERPLLIIMRKPGSDVSAKDILAYLDGKIATWWMPDAVEFVDEIPHTATGKIQKMVLREQFGGYEF